MSKIITKIQKLSIVCMVLFITASMFTIVAGAKSTVNINGIEYEHNETVTYVAEIKSDKLCGGLNAKITYDQSVLEVIGETVSMPDCGLTVANYETPGSIGIACTDVSGLDCSAGKVFFSASFKIKGTEDNTIKLEVEEIYDEQIVDMESSSYEITEKISVGEYSGEIVDPNNYEEYGISKGDLEKKPNSSVSTPNQGTPTNVTDSNTIIYIIVGLVVVAVIIAVVAVVYRKNKTNM
ncbi:MAG: hypothetical protein II233_01545 [Clostridia bacterium]|nr:hypothetical protein [Clostridia bacterium]